MNQTEIFVEHASQRKCTCTISKPEPFGARFFFLFILPSFEMYFHCLFRPGFDNLMGKMTINDADVCFAYLLVAFDITSNRSMRTHELADWLAVPFSNFAQSGQLKIICRNRQWHWKIFGEEMMSRDEMIVNKITFCMELGRRQSDGSRERV